MTWVGPPTSHTCARHQVAPGETTRSTDSVRERSRIPSAKLTLVSTQAGNRMGLLTKDTM